MFAYSIYDKVAKVYNVPFFARDENTAKRCVLGMLSKDSQLVLYPGSYELSQLGYFNEAQGYFDSERVLVSSLVDLIPDGLKEFVLDGSVNK